MTLLEELGMVGPRSALSPEERSRYKREWRKRQLLKPGVRERLNAYQRQAYKKNPDRCKKYARDWVAQNPERKRENDKRWREANPKRRKENLGAWYEKNRERCRALQDKNRAENREQYNAAERERYRRRYYSEPCYRIAKNLRRRLSGLCKNAGSSSKTLDLNYGDLRDHLESLWQEGMSWENYGSGWHIDHKLPCTSFDLTDPEEVRKCFALSNLQPMWAADNIRKSNKILEEYVNAAA